MYQMYIIYRYLGIINKLFHNPFVKIVWFFSQVSLFTAYHRVIQTLADCTISTKKQYTYTFCQYYVHCLEYTFVYSTHAIPSQNISIVMSIQFAWQTINIQVSMVYIPPSPKCLYFIGPFNNSVYDHSWHTRRTPS